MVDWQEGPLEGFLDLITYGFTNPMPTTTSGPYMVTARDINGGRILYDQARNTSRAAFEGLLTDKSRPKIGDVLVTKDGTLGRMAVVDRPDICINQSVALLRPNQKIRSKFLKYLLDFPVNYRRMIGDASGSTIQHIYISRLAKMVVCVPDLDDQDLILGILVALDEKIDLNRRMNETLEAMARAIFKDWFVDFGPTRAKMAGATPYLVPDIWALFPDRLDDEGKPEGWNTRPLAEVTAEIRRGVSPRYVAEGGVLVLNQKCIRERSISFGPARRHDYESKPVQGRELVIGDILVNSTGVGTLGRVAQVHVLEETTIVDSHVTVVRANKDRIDAIYLGVDLTAREQEIEALGEGSTGQTELSRSRLGQLLVLIPSRPLLSAFAASIGPAIDLSTLKTAQSLALAQTRDLLLPKLMSGEIRVKDAERAVEQVA